jgi:glycyl-tRNA synthetase beta chain
MATPAKSVGRAKNLLIELGTEELPPKALKLLAQSFAKNFFTGLVDSGVVEDKPDQYRYYATPRRLAVWVKGVSPKQVDQVEERRGPAVQAAFDDKGNPTPAAEGFARSCGVPVSRLKRKETDKGSWLVFEKKSKGKRLNVLVTQSLQDSIKALPIPRRMRWGNSDVEFVRPVHWLLALYGSDLIRTEALGLKADRVTRGHRFHCPGVLKVPSADRYVNTLKTSGFVIADYEVRQGMIEKQATRLAIKAGGRAVIDSNLLDEVTGLVEWPVASIGEFDDKYLKLPREVLVSTMDDHQKYFHVTSEKGKLVPLFVSVSNIKSRTPKRVRQGNERVLRARLSDAEFFWLTDQKIKLVDRIDSLKGVLFHNKLGTIYDKSRRLEKLAQHIATKLEVDRKSVQRAARLCKVDLVTEMVGEFPELQGTIGKYYAINQGEDRQVANAIDGHYKPRFASDKLPSKPMAQCVALADRIDTLVGIFATAEIPTGDRDPFALRRAALGVLRIIIEKKLNLDLRELFSQSMKLYTASDLKNIDTSDAVITQVFDFTIERLKGYFQARGFSAEEFASVQACNPTSPLDFAHRLQAVSHFFSKRRSAAESLASANKRIANILSKADFPADGAIKFSKKLTTEDAEKHLAESVATISSEVRGYFKAGQYDSGFERLSMLKSPVDTFFDQVMVMHEDDAIRNNRLALLNGIRHLFLGAADISHVRIE